MMPTKYEQALKAIQNVHADTSKPIEETLEGLQGLRDELDILIEAIKESM